MALDSCAPARRTARRALATRVLAGTALGCLGALTFAALGCASESLHGTSLRPRRPAPEIVAAGAEGKQVRLPAHDGRIVVLSFGYTSCPDVCPTTLSKMKAIYRRLGDARADRVSLVFLSIDPERDTEARVRDYVSAFDPRILGLRLTGAALPSTLLAYGVTSERHDVPPGRYEERPLVGAYYSIDHTAGYFVIDRAGSLRLRFPAEAPVDDVVSDLLALSSEGDPQ